MMSMNSGQACDGFHGVNPGPTAYRGEPRRLVNIVWLYDEPQH
jgi:hypothetical protein